jgi:hypothetical protein
MKLIKTNLHAIIVANNLKSHFMIVFIEKSLSGRITLSGLGFN